MNIYLTPTQGRMLTGAPEDKIRQWADSGRIRSATKRLYSPGHLVVRTADLIEAAVIDGYCTLAEILEPIIDDRCHTCGRTGAR
ncbi:MAG: hypothetical protein IH941_00925 [Acidobacteria bacterium]|nr:hypothetical protein [Acidobacteriota bacterium]